MLQASHVLHVTQYHVSQQETQQRYNAVLQMYGEKEEETEELRLDLEDVKAMYKAQVGLTNAASSVIPCLHYRIRQLFTHSFMLDSYNPVSYCKEIVYVGSSAQDGPGNASSETQSSESKYLLTSKIIHCVTREVTFSFKLHFLNLALNFKLTSGEEYYGQEFFKIHTRAS